MSLFPKWGLRIFPSGEDCKIGYFDISISTENSDALEIK